MAWVFVDVYVWDQEEGQEYTLCSSGDSRDWQESDSL